MIFRNFCYLLAIWLSFKNLQGNATSSQIQINFSALAVYVGGSTYRTAPFFHHTLFTVTCYIIPTLKFVGPSSAYPSVSLLVHPSVFQSVHHTSLFDVFVVTISLPHLPSFYLIKKCLWGLALYIKMCQFLWLCDWSYL